MASATKAAQGQGRMEAELGGVVVLDFGGQYTQLIARRIREQQVFSSILPCTVAMEEMMKLEPVGVVLSGGPSSVYDAEAPKCDPKLLALGVPILGICYGMQWITHTLGGKVERAERREYGRAELNIENEEGSESHLFCGVKTSLRVWNSHGDHVLMLPKGFRTMGRTANAVAAVEDAKRKIYAVEFHPEVNHTEQGTEILRNFLFRVCGVYRRNGRGDTEEGGADQQSDLRFKRRGGLHGGCGASASSDWGPADQHFCGYRDVEEERICRDAGDAAGEVRVEGGWD
jgi:GMP synthase (glutamine-hydrolysing) A subunit